MSNPPVRCKGPNTICFVSRILEAIRHTVKTMLNTMNSTDTIVLFFFMPLIRFCYSYSLHILLVSTCKGTSFS